MTNSERASYIRGLMDGPNAKETKVLNAIVELLDDLCLSVEELDEGLDELAEQVDEIDYDLGELEEDYYELDEDDECGCGCGHHHHHDDFDDAEFEVTCPSCGDTIQLNDEMLEEGSIVCPGSTTVRSVVRLSAADRALSDFSMMHSTPSASRRRR